MDEIAKMEASSLAHAPAPPGFAWILRFSPEGAVSPGSIEDLRAPPSDGFVWIHFDCADKVGRAAIEQVGWIDAHGHEALLGVADHQFVDSDADRIAGALLDHETDLAGHISAGSTDYLRFFLMRSVLVTARRKPLQSAEAIRWRLLNGHKFGSVGDVFEALVEKIVDGARTLLGRLATDLDRIEERVVLEGAARDQRASLGLARRDAIRLVRQGSGLYDTLARLDEAREHSEPAGLEELGAHLAQRAEGFLRDVNNAQDRARLLQEEMNAILTVETNDRLFDLTLMTAVLLPATFVTGYFGMNTKQLVFSDNESGTIYATLMCLVASGLTLWFLRRRGR